jgi:hypothetical protein
MCSTSSEHIERQKPREAEMTMDRFSVGTVIRFVRERVKGPAVIVGAVATATSNGRVDMILADGSDCAMVVGGDRVVPGVLLWFEDGHDMDDDDPIEVTDVVRNRIDVQTQDGVERYILVGQEPIIALPPSEEAAGGA